ncbi:hypothetical protein GCM10009548_91490 [Streptomyces malaysiensis subsp. malaysiensis]|uniref:hypothetical protein n=2 Tax=Streptomyces TaxID=1883 RepID=UPI002FEBBBA9
MTMSKRSKPPTPLPHWAMPEESWLYFPTIYEGGKQTVKRAAVAARGGLRGAHGTVPGARIRRARTTVRPADLLAAVMMPVCSRRTFVAQAEDSGHTVSYRVPAP